MADDVTTILPDPVLGARHEAERRAVAAAIAIPAHVVQAKGHGHAGTAMAMAPLAHVLFQRILRHDPADPMWEGRDRFVLSAGHASLLLYTQLHLTGYDLSLADVAASRQLDARTPGHPELGHTPGVEMSTGPLGQGVASAVGIALAARRDEALHGVGTGLFDPTVFVLAGDGCLQEGVSSEASSLAGTLGLENLVLIWDDNRITIDGGTDDAFSEDVRARYAAYGWRVLEVDDFRDLAGIERTLDEARTRSGRPTLVAVRSVIGAPSTRIGGTPAAHSGGFGDEEVAAVKTALGFAADATLDDLVTEDALAETRSALERGRRLHEEWRSAYERWMEEAPGAVMMRRCSGVASWAPDEGFAGSLAVEAGLGAIDEVAAPEEGASVATRATNGKVIQALQAWGGLLGGSADLSGSTSVAVPGEAMSATNPGGDFVHFGIREHAMAAMLSGIALHGLWRPYASTYLAFSDYQRPALRLQALMGLPVIHVYTHDSVAVGEDGPTHQPVEQTAALRTIPGLDVVRPADGAEVIAAWRRILAQPTGPTALVLSRQGVPGLPERAELDAAVAHGGYVAWQHGEGDALAIVATGSEVQLALAAARTLADEGVAVRVVSMPCVEWFEAAPAEWRDAVLPPTLRARVAVEAGRGDAWWRWVGLDGRVVSIDEFGESGAGDQVMARRGMTVDAVLAAAREVLPA
ncbi:transketolase [Agrococcus versicolor]|uniref:Transketolase n=1 Tax=Agrococcus versicolor TaxID=501482 RepID=A0ABP5MPW0_9MICO